MNGFGGISDLTTAKRGRSRSVNAENPTGEKGKGIDRFDLKQSYDL